MSERFWNKYYFLIVPFLATLARAHAAELHTADLLHAALDKGFNEWLLAVRRHLHTIPELSFEEFKTSEYIRGQLDSLGIQYRYPVAGTGIVASIGPGSTDSNGGSRGSVSGGSDGGWPVVALRADMDGLPIQEAVDVEFRSTHPGRMHACGHDAHSAMLLAAARVLKQHEQQLPGRVLLLWQPAEEGQGGARRMMAEGALAGVQAIFGLHVWPSAPSGTVLTLAGPIMAGSTRFSLALTGSGGHAAAPHQVTCDPVLAGAAAVVALQALVSRETSPLDSAVVSVTRFNTGPGAPNVISDRVEIQGTVRALRPSTFDRIVDRVGQVVSTIAVLNSCGVEGLEWSLLPYPPTVNDAPLAAFVAEVAEELGEATAAAAAVTPGGGSSSADGGSGAKDGAPKVRFEALQEPVMLAEDFSFYGGANGTAACFSMLGIGDAGLATTAGLHTPGFQVDERVLPLGGALHASLAVRMLQRLAAGRGSKAPETHAGSSAASQGEL